MTHTPRDEALEAEAKEWQREFVRGEFAPIPHASQVDAYLAGHAAAMQKMRHEYDGVLRRKEELLIEMSMHASKLNDDVERLRSGGIHTCHDECKRVECVQRREIERLRAALEEIANRMPGCACMDTPNLARQALAQKKEGSDE